MFHSAEEKATFILLLQQIDLDTALARHKEPCNFCDGKLHRADYKRKSRGLDQNDDESTFTRYSLCCSVDGCRKRHLPKSVMFFGRTVYLFFFMILTTVVQDKSISKISKDMGVSVQTIYRWRSFWRALFPLSKAWKHIRPMFAIPPQTSTLPLGLFERLGYEEKNINSLLKGLKLISDYSQ